MPNKIAFTLVFAAELLRVFSNTLIVFLLVYWIFGVVLSQTIPTFFFAAISAELIYYCLWRGE